MVYEDDYAVAIEDRNPKAPVHLLIIPRQHIPSLSKIEEAHNMTVGHLHWVATEMARRRGVIDTGFRTVINSGAGAGQTVFHLHLHLLGGRPLDWPPG
jgi:histidine triad (HIT) family protein